MTRDVVRVVSLLPALLSTYGDRGNVVVLERRLAWRGIEVEVVNTDADDPMPAQGDLYVLGGAEDDALFAALELLKGPTLASVIERQVPVLAVCAGLQLLGETLLDREGTQVAGLGVLDLRTHVMPDRALGETVVRPDAALGLPPLSGFVNHSGGTRLGPAARPLGEIVHGSGNAGPEDPVDGALQGSVVATYLHGPVLSRNPALADLLLSRAVGETLPPLPAGPEDELRRERLAATASTGSSSRRRLRGWRR